MTALRRPYAEPYQHALHSCGASLSREDQPEVFWQNFVEKPSCPHKEPWTSSPTHNLEVIEEPLPLKTENVSEKSVV